MTEHKFLSGGKWKKSDQTYAVTNPYNGETVGEVFEPSPADVDETIAAAARAADEWRKTPLHVRVDILSKVERAVRDNLDELAKTVALEAGKPIKTARGEVGRAAGVIADSITAAKTFGGEVFPVDLLPATEKRVGIIRRFPLGAIAAITPFNFPFMLVAHKHAPAIGAGNTLVHKPASNAPLSALKLAEIFMEAGTPDGILNVLPLRADAAIPLVDDPRLKGLTFTGSPAVGWELKERAPRKKVSLELGGNAAAVVCEDADVLYAAGRCVAGGYTYAGQSCISVQRIIVHESRIDDFMDAYLPQVQALKVGDPLDESTDVGPLITEREAMRVEMWIRESGGRVLCGGGRDGSCIEPAVLADVRREADVWSQEVFGPVTVVAQYSDFDEALRMVNDSAYGLQAGVFTNDVNRIWKAYSELEVGGLIAGDMPTFRADNQPYGGVKKSGYGREGARWAMEEMSEPRVLIIDLSRQS